jgi:hypothetical protein
MEITVESLGAQTRDVDYVETHTDQTHFNVFEYSVTNNGLLSNKRFRLDGNAVKVNSILV